MTNDQCPVTGRAPHVSSVTSRVSQPDIPVSHFLQTSSSGSTGNVTGVTGRHQDLVCPRAGSLENKLGGKWGWEMLQAAAHLGLSGHLCESSSTPASFQHVGFSRCLLMSCLCFLPGILAPGRGDTETRSIQLLNPMQGFDADIWTKRALCVLKKNGISGIRGPNPQLCLCPHKPDGNFPVYLPSLGDCQVYFLWICYSCSKLIPSFLCESPDCCPAEHKEESCTFFLGMAGLHPPALLLSPLRGWH